MSQREILLWPDPCLSEVCSPLADANLPDSLVADLFDTMYAAPGRGLAAPQIGEMVRVFVMDAGWKTGEKTPRLCIDPQILWSSDERTSGEEGCLSIPGILAEVNRPAEIILAYRDASGAQINARLTGFEAACAQHELDNLNGVVTFDRVPVSLRDDLIARYEAGI